MMQLTSFDLAAASARPRSASERPTAPAERVPTRRKSRRLRPSQNRTPFLPSKSSMGEPPDGSWPRGGGGRSFPLMPLSGRNGYYGTAGGRPCNRKLENRPGDPGEVAGLVAFHSPAPSPPEGR